MNEHTTATDSPSVRFHHWFMTYRIVICAALSLWIGLTFNGSILEAATLPTADEIFQEFHIPDSDQKSIRQGKIVDWSPSEGSDRELAIGFIGLIKGKPKDLYQSYREALVLKEVPVITASGTPTGEGTLEDFAGVKLQPNAEKEAKRYLNAQPGNELNLDAKEIAAFQALKAGGDADAVPVEKVEALVRQGLLARYQAYRKEGLSGIAPYERGGTGRLRAGDELLLSTKGLTGTAKYLPAFHKFLLNYPNGLTQEEAKNLEEYFFWLNIDVFGRPTYVLVHRMLYHVGDAALAVERHFYASHDYNSMLQQVAVIPTKDGTVLFYAGRVSTDQVAGFTSAMLHPVSRAIAAPYLKDMFLKIQAKEGKK